MTILCVLGKGKKSILIFSTYPSILLYQSFGKWKRMSNSSLAMFIGPLNTEKLFFRSKSEKMIFPTNSHRVPFGLPVPSDDNKCCVCCLKKQHMSPKFYSVQHRLLGGQQFFDPQKIENFDFFKLNVLLPTMIIYGKTHLGGFVSPLKGLERYFRADLSKSIFHSKIGCFGKDFPSEGGPAVFRPQKIENFDFFKLSVLLPPMIIYGKTHLGGFVSPLKGLELYFRADLSRSIFSLKNWLFW